MFVLVVVWLAFARESLCSIGVVLGPLLAWTKG